MNRVMIDLETMGTRPGSAILSIGAVNLDHCPELEPYLSFYGGGFYERVDLDSCLDLGMSMDVSTIQWWMQQSEEARSELLKPGIDLRMALGRFAAWIPDDCEVWGNGSDFDNALLAEAFRICKMPIPWKFTMNRCYRTAKNLYPDVTIKRTGTHHNALDDARSQAAHLMHIFSAHPELCGGNP